MLRVYTANRLENLLDIMKDRMRTPDISPLEKVTVCIQTPGMQRWIGLKLAETCGISANLDFLFPGALMKRLAGVSHSEKSPWAEKPELLWRIFDRLVNLPDKPVFAEIASYLESDAGLIRTYRLAGRIADTFDQYQVYRPLMVLNWLKPVPKDLPTDEKDMWQPELFRSLFDMENPCKTTVFDRFIKNCRKNPQADTAKSIHVFGISFMPGFFVDMLRAAAAFTDVNFYLLSPTREFWSDSMSTRQTRKLERRTRKTAEELYIAEKHELLDNLGSAGRDFFDIILGSDDTYTHEEFFTEIDKTSMLSALQAEILDQKYGVEQFSDDSIVISNCHNPLREVQTLYDQLLDIFAKNTDLTPADILVMTPDIESYAPYIRAVFDNPYGQKEYIPYSIADISEKQANKPAGIFLELLKVIRGDFSLSDVIKLLSYEMLADCLHINRSNLGTLAQILAKTGVFWSFNKEHLLAEGLDIDDIFTWEKGLRRVALGLAEGGGNTLYSDAAGREIPFSMLDDIGGIMHFAKRVSEFAAKLRGTKTAAEWCTLMFDITEEFFSSTAHADDAVHLTKCIMTIHDESSGTDIQIPAEPVIERLTEVLSQSKGAKGFITGRVTFCAMLPMRSIPFKVIAIMGLNENTFPRQKVTLEFDLMAKHPHQGDRDNRDSDRYLFLETLISAEQKLLLSYCGQSERDNSITPPSTLVTELCTHLAVRFGVSDLTTLHKLHPFSKDYFAGRLFTYSKARYDACIAFSGVQAKQNTPPDTAEIENTPPEAVSAYEFENFFIDPPDHFMRRVLGINPNIRDETLPECEMLTLEGLDEYKLTNSTLKSLMAGDCPQDELEYLYKTAQLPPDNLGGYFIEHTLAESGKMSDKASEYFDGMPESVNVDIEVSGLRISGVIEGVSGSNHVYIRPASLKPKDMIRGWIRHLLLNSTGGYTTHLIGKKSSKTFTPENPDHLKALAELFRQGHRKPLRFHITDGIRLFIGKMPKGISDDEHSNMSANYISKILFGGSPVPDTDITSKIVAQMLKNTGDADAEKQ